MTQLSDGSQPRRESPAVIEADADSHINTAPVTFTRQHADALYDFLQSFNQLPTDDSAGEFHIVSKMADKFYEYCISGPGEHVIEDVESAVVDQHHENMAQIFATWKDALMATDPALIERAFSHEPEKCAVVLATIATLSKTPPLSGEEIFPFMVNNPEINDISPVAFQVKSRRIYPQSLILSAGGDSPLQQLTAESSKSNDIDRIYINCNPDQVTPIVRAVFNDPELSANLHSMKLMNFALGEQLGDVNLSRYDRIVLYCKAGTEGDFLECLSQCAQSAPDKFFAGKVPLFSREVLPGISLGSEPVQSGNRSKSFSNARAELMLELCRDITRELIESQPEGKAMEFFMESGRTAYRGEQEAQYYHEEMAEFLADLKGIDAGMIMDRVLHRTVMLLDRDQFHAACVRLLPNVASSLKINPDDLAGNL